MFSKLIKDHSGDVWESLEIAWRDFSLIWMILDYFQRSWFFMKFDTFHKEESASHPLPLQEEVPQVKLREKDES